MGKILDYMSAKVVYTLNGETKSIPVEAADRETIKNAVAQWQANEWRLKKNKIEIVEIIFL